MSITPSARNAFPYVAIAVCVVAMGYALSFGTLPPADFTFVNETEIKSVDPALVTGEPEGRIIDALFEGLYREHPKTLEPVPAIAERHELSEDLKTYTFYLRKDAKWSDGAPLTAHDFVWAWRRFLHPETACQYSYQLYYLKNAKKYNTSLVEPDDPVEIELDDRPEHPSGRPQLFPRGTVLKGKLVHIDKPRPPKLSDDASDEERSDAEATWRKKWVYRVSVDGRERTFSRGDHDAAEKCLWVLVDFMHVGARAIDDYTLEVELENSTPYFLQLMTFYPMHPVQRACVEKHGTPNWTKAENIITSGPYGVGFRRIRDRIRLVKNPHYWNAENVDFETIDALAVESQITALNMYLNGQVDWITDVLDTVVPAVENRPDFHKAPQLTTYFYRINTLREPGDNPLVRRALNLTIDKQAICDVILSSGQVAARSLVPPGMSGYDPGLCGEFNVEKAQALLAEAGYPGGRGLPTIEILYNTTETHRVIAEKIQSDWKKHLGIDVELKNQAWQVYLASQRNLEYSVCRAGWIADYADPNSFLDMFVTDGENNNTGWSNRRYDELIERSRTQTDPAARLQTLHEAEQILMEEQPIIPIYFYVSTNMIRPDVKGFYVNVRDRHPLINMSIDRQPSVADEQENTNP